MTVSINEYREPKWVSLNDADQATLSRDNNERFYKFDTDPRRWRDGFKQSGYNVNHNSIRVERVNINRDDVTLKGY
jgi:hypothetical protein